MSQHEMLLAVPSPSTVTFANQLRILGISYASLFIFCINIFSSHLRFNDVRPRGPCHQVWMHKFIHKNLAAPFFSLSKKFAENKNSDYDDDKNGLQRRSMREEVAAASAVEEDATQGPFMVNEVRLKTVSHFSGDQQAANDHISDRLEYAPNVRKARRKEIEKRKLKKCTPKSIFVNVQSRVVDGDKYCFWWLN